MPTGAPAATVAATAAASAATAAAAAATAAAAAAAPSAAADTSGTPAAPVSSGTPPATASSMPPLRSGSGERLAQQATTPLSGLSGRTMFIWALVLAGMARTGSLGRGWKPHPAVCEYGRGLDCSEANAHARACTVFDEAFGRKFDFELG